MTVFLGDSLNGHIYYKRCSNFFSGCTGRTLQNILDCDFANDMCGLQGSNLTWIRSTGAKSLEDRKLQIPMFGSPKGSYFIYSNSTSDVETGKRGNLYRQFQFQVTELVSCLRFFKNKDFLPDFA